MKKYIVFAMAAYEERGGLEDIANSYDTLEEATGVCSDFATDRINRHYTYIVDRDTWEKVS